MINRIMEYVNTLTTLETIQQANWLVLQIRCINDAREKDLHPIEVCQPGGNDVEWKFTVFWFTVKGYRVFLSTIYFYYIEIFLYLTIGSI